MEKIIEPNLLDAEAFRNALANELATAHQNIVIATAYLTAPGCAWLLDNIGRNPSVRIVVRWQLQDLVRGASDLGVYPLIRECGWEFRVNERLHAKMWLIDEKSLYVGSSNATSRGLGLTDMQNIEYGVRVTARQEDVTTFQALLNRSVLVTDDLFEEIAGYVKDVKRTVESDEKLEWPSALISKLRVAASVQKIWVSECFHTDGKWLGKSHKRLDQLHPDIAHDLSLLGLMSNVVNMNDLRFHLRERIVQSNIYMWLLSELKRSESGQLYFGELSASLHDALADDPRPYRKTVKILLSNVLGWIHEIGGLGVQVDRPRYSQLVKLIEMT